MKIRFLEDTYIRKAPRVAGDPPVGAVFAGSEIDVEPDTTLGDTVLHNNRWFYDKNGWYYWSGKAEKVAEALPTSSGETIGGVMVMPAPPDNTDLTAEPAIPGNFPPLANDDVLLNQEAIPEGETRVVPSLATLLAGEARARTGTTLPPPPPELESIAIFPLAGGQALESTRRENVAIAATDVSPRWQNATPQKLNWGVQNYRIARDWWQQRHLTGKGVSIAILSTGIRPDYPELGNKAAFFQFPEDNNPMADRHGLGTQAAVVAAGAGPTIFGVAPEARLLIGKIGEQDHALTVEGLMAGLRWAINAKADVVAMLVDFPEMEEAWQHDLQALINQAVAQGILLVAPVGTQDNKKPASRSPAQMGGVLSVGAHDAYGQRSSFSARSYDLDLLAPGEGLLTFTQPQTSGWNLKSTAIAAAFVAGMLALVRQWQREHQQETAPEVVFDLLRETAVSRRSFNKGEDVEYGYGILNPVEVLRKLDATYTGPDQP